MSTVPLILSERALTSVSVYALDAASADTRISSERLESVFVKSSVAICSSV